jgi:hypothetical protein
VVWYRIKIFVLSLNLDLDPDPEPGRPKLSPKRKKLRNSVLEELSAMLKASPGA